MSADDTTERASFENCPSFFGCNLVSLVLNTSPTPLKARSVFRWGSSSGLRPSCCHLFATRLMVVGRKSGEQQATRHLGKKQQPRANTHTVSFSCFCEQTQLACR